VKQPLAAGDDGFLVDGGCLVELPGLALVELIPGIVAAAGVAVALAVDVAMDLPVPWTRASGGIIGVALPVRGRSR